MTVKRFWFDNHPDFKEYKHSVEGITIFINYDKLIAHGFIGRQSKSKWSYKFEDLPKLIRFVESKIRIQYNTNEKKKEKKLQRKKDAVQHRNNVAVGDIFHTHWGYNSTIVEFFQVVAKPAPATVIVRQIRADLVEGNYQNGKISALPDDFISGEKRCRLDHHGNICKLDKYGHSGFKTDQYRKHCIYSD